MTDLKLISSKMLQNNENHKHRCCKCNHIIAEGAWMMVQTFAQTGTDDDRYHINRYCIKCSKEIPIQLEAEE